MKRIIKNPIFTFILGALIFGGIVGVSAYTILANDIGYTPSDSTWKKSNGEDITNVKDAIDELYGKSNTTISELNSQITSLQTQLAVFNNAQCISGNFKCSSCSTSGGQDIGINFEPSIIYIHSNDFGRFIGFNNSIDSTNVYYRTPSSNSYDQKNSLLYMNNNLILHNFGSAWEGINFQFIACK